MSVLQHICREICHCGETVAFSPVRLQSTAIQDSRKGLKLPIQRITQSNPRSQEMSNDNVTNH